MDTIQLGGNHYQRVPQICNNDCLTCEADDAECLQGCEGCSVSYDLEVCEAIKAAYGRLCGYHIWKATKTTGILGSATQDGFGF